jgi:hypothetical protein
MKTVIKQVALLMVFTELISVYSRRVGREISSNGIVKVMLAMLMSRRYTRSRFTYAA